MKNPEKIIIIAIIMFFSSGMSAEELFFIERGDTIFLTAPKLARAATSDDKTDDWLTTQDGFRVKVAEGIIVELRSEAFAENVFSIPAVKSYERLTANIFLVIPADPNRQFELSRNFLKSEFVVNSHPNLIRERRPR